MTKQEKNEMLRGVNDTLKKIDADLSKISLTYQDGNSKSYHSKEKLKLKSSYTLIKELLNKEVKEATIKDFIKNHQVKLTKAELKKQQQEEQKRIEEENEALRRKVAKLEAMIKKGDSQ